MSSDQPAWKEFSITFKDGVELKGWRYSSEDKKAPSDTKSTEKHRILCWHGWMDNCNTFWNMAPILIDELPELDLVALDFPGHGRSSHKSLDGPSVVLMDYVYYVHEVLLALKWSPEETTLIGHSMGAAISLMYSAAFPVKKLILLDSLGPEIKEPLASKHLRRHIEARLKGKQNESTYDSLDHAVETRMQSARMFPGNQWIAKSTARRLVEGASSELEDGRLVFHHDQRLKMPSIIYLTKEQAEDLYQSVATSETKTCLLLAKDGMPFPPQMVTSFRKLLQPTVFETLPGSHHFHADDDTATEVSKTVVSFLLSSGSQCEMRHSVPFSNI